MGRDKDRIFIRRPTLRIYLPTPKSDSSVVRYESFRFKTFGDIPLYEEYVLIGLAKLECWVIGMGDGMERPWGSEHTINMIKKFAVGRMDEGKERRRLKHSSLLRGVELVGYRENSIPAMGWLEINRMPLPSGNKSREWRGSKA